MKSVTINKDVAEVLLSNLSAFKNSQNCIRFAIGLVNTGDGLGSKMIIVNGGQMGQFCFKTSLPAEEFTITENTPYMYFNLKADEFCRYMSGLLNFKCDITLGYDGSSVHLNAGEQAHVVLGTIAEESCEPLLADDANEATLRISMKVDAFMNVMRKGGFMSEAKPCHRKIRDRVVFSVENGRLTVYSTDTNVIAKAWCDVSVCKLDANAALQYLRMKGDTLDDNGKARIFSKFQELCNKPEELVAYAETEGFVSTNVVRKNALEFLQNLGKSMDKEAQRQLLAEMTPFQNDILGMIYFAKSKGFAYEDEVRVSVPHECAVTLQKLFAGDEEIYINFTPNNIHVGNGSHILVTMSLAGEVASVYKGTVDNVWGTYEWDVKVVVDREAFSRALNLMGLNSEKSAMHITVDNQGLVTSKDGNIIHTPIIASEGNVSMIDSYFKNNLVSCVVSKLSNGNLIIRFKSNEGDNSYPICISNGGISEESVDSFEYIMPTMVDVDDDAESEEDGATENAAESEAV